ncbi:MAG TPA: alpha/beta fold hydrolase [Chthoniobacterales bacterium]|nr:alpha/beta fold hydrolase [Chthoniobacterales bacterium]
MRSSVKIACRLLIAGVAAILSAAVPAQSVNRPDSAPIGQQAHTLRREAPHKIDIQYLLFLPEEYDKSSNHWPLILYLHGGSARGNDIGQMKKLGLTAKVEADSKFPFIVVSPQCHQGEIWTDVAALGAVLDEVASTHRVDPDRVYISGHSMGGRGALYTAYKMPERFVAIVSLGPSSPITAWAGKLARVPLRLFHGSNDQFTPLKEVEELVRAIEAAGGRPQFTTLPGRDHYILDVYDKPELYEWLAGQRRKTAPVK